MIKGLKFDRYFASLKMWKWVLHLCTVQNITLTHTHTHTHTTVLQPSLILSGTIWVSRHQKSKTNLDLQEIASGIGMSWAICKSAPWPRHNHTSIPPLSFLQAGIRRTPFLLPNRQRQSTDGKTVQYKTSLIKNGFGKKEIILHLVVIDQCLHWPQPWPWELCPWPWRWSEVLMIIKAQLGYESESWWNFMQYFPSWEFIILYSELSVLWRCWLAGQNGIPPVKNLSCGVSA